MEEDLSAYKTLVLNADYRPLSYFPISVCSWQTAIKAVVLDRVNVVLEYDREVHSQHLSMRIPSVVVLKQYIAFASFAPALTRTNVFLRDRYTCQYCGDRFPARDLTLDHVMPRSFGGRTEWDNIVTACFECNSKKSNKLPGKNFDHPKSGPFAPSNAELQHISAEVLKHRYHQSWENYLRF